MFFDVGRMRDARKFLPETRLPVSDVSPLLRRGGFFRKINCRVSTSRKQKTEFRKQKTEWNCRDSKARRRNPAVGFTGAPPQTQASESGSWRRAFHAQTMVDPSHFTL
jgi:hypothetical protein